jgi:hypothetical protein
MDCRKKKSIGESHEQNKIVSLLAKRVFSVFVIFVCDVDAVRTSIRISLGCV